MRARLFVLLVLDAAEAIKERVQMLWSYSDTCILDINSNAVAAILILAWVLTNCDRSLPRVFERVTDKIEDDAFPHRTIDPNSLRYALQILTNDDILEPKSTGYALKVCRD